jgi:hypothetical protein
MLSKPRHIPPSDIKSLQYLFKHQKRKAWAFSGDHIPAVHLYFFLFLKEKKKKDTGPIRAIRPIQGFSINFRKTKIHKKLPQKAQKTEKSQKKKVLTTETLRA